MYENATRCTKCMRYIRCTRYTRCTRYIRYTKCMRKIWGNTRQMEDIQIGFVFNRARNQ